MKVSVVTSVGVGYEKYLEEAAGSLCVQGVDVEWLVWLDGLAPGVESAGRSGRVGPVDPSKSSVASALYQARLVVEGSGGSVILGASARPHGSFASRNLALAYASAPVVVNLDADDTFHPGALVQLGEHLEASGEKWVVGHSTISDGSSIARPIEDGSVQRGVVADLWMRSRNPPLHPGAMMVATPLVRALGGWAAMPAEGDTHLALAVTEVSDGSAVDVPVLRYRSWDGQITKSGWRSRSDEDRYESMRERVLALRSLRLNA